MPRNRSEQPPHECSTIAPDFYELLRVYAKDNVERGVSTRLVRIGDIAWGTRVAAASKLFAALGADRRGAWWRFQDRYKRDYVVDYMEYLYATQSK